MTTHFALRIRSHVSAELALAGQAEASDDPAEGFRHLERAHVLGQAATVEHVRVHVRMLLWAVRHRQSGEIAGQLLRILGAATKTAFGLIPHGNTGGADVSPFKSMPIPDDLAELVHGARKQS